MPDQGQPGQPYEMAPTPGQTASQRKAELDAARFVLIRNLAYLVYKKPDGSALMTYPETLDNNREIVKNTIINASKINTGSMRQSCFM